MSKPISNPTLPPRQGYVEVETDDGQRVYEATPEQLQIEQAEKSREQLILDNQTLQQENRMKTAQIISLNQQTEFYGDCIANLAAMVFE